MDYYFEKSAFSSFENSLFHTPFHTRAQNEGMTGDKHLSTEPKKHQKMAIIRKKAISFSADGFGPSGESRTHGLLNPMQISKPRKTTVYQGFYPIHTPICSNFCSSFLRASPHSAIGKKGGLHQSKLRCLRTCSRIFALFWLIRLLGSI